MNFDQKLRRAIERGERVRDARQQTVAEQQLDAAEMRAVHSQSRLELSEKIESALGALGDHFPGFNYSTIVDETGWGARIVRDDLRLTGRSSTTLHSRLEVYVTPLKDAAILELVGKGTIHNREVFHRRHYQNLAELDLSSFRDLVDFWILEYAELFAAADKPFRGRLG